jgi:hypothetical protein
MVVVLVVLTSCVLECLRNIAEPLWVLVLVMISGTGSCLMLAPQFCVCISYGLLGFRN